MIFSFLLARAGRRRTSLM
uniref:Uncharacterized protein n=1 Tax=Arundo donax TaxID=35708 RepID=A0A0A9H393_ARUDO